MSSYPLYPLPSQIKDLEQALAQLALVRARVASAVLLLTLYRSHYTRKLRKLESTGNWKDYFKEDIKELKGYLALIKPIEQILKGEI